MNAIPLPRNKAALRRLERKVPALAATLELAPAWRSFFQELVGTPALEAAITPLFAGGGYERIMLGATEKRELARLTEDVSRAIQGKRT